MLENIRFSPSDSAYSSTGYDNQKRSQMLLKGIPSSSGIIIGKAKILKPENLIIAHETIPESEIESEISRYSVAQNKLVQQFLSSLKKASKESTNIASIIESNLLILTDPMITEAVNEHIKQGFSAESSIVGEYEKQRNFIKNSKDELLRERAGEIDHIKTMLLNSLRNQSVDYNIGKNAVVVAVSLTTSDIVNFKEAGVKAIITEVGSIVSHASILARSYDIPAVIGVKDATLAIAEGETVIVDGFAGVVISKPNREYKKLYEKKIDEIEEHKRVLGKLVKLPAETLDGKRIHIMTNVNFLEDVRAGMINGADGVGLVRSENLIMELKHIPDEEIQYKWYKEIAERAYPNPVTIRVFDIGSDKYSEGLPMTEDNPALGLRGIRFLLSRTDVFATQLRAILRASINKNIRIMIPMISSLHEVEHTLSILNECKKQLDESDIQYDNKIPFGIMIETPAAALIADGLATAVDFFSIGTNDLTQYTLAADRTNDMVSDVFDSLHPSVLRLIKMTVEAARKNNITVGVCGELAGHSASTDLLIGLGIDELSVAPSLVLELKNRVRHSSLLKTESFANDIMSSTSYLDIRERLDRAMTEESLYAEHSLQEN